MAARAEVMGLFPYRPRPGQERAVSEVADAIARNGHLVLEAGTGTGKTVSVLAPAVATALSSSRRVLYLTRTNSQQAQVVEEMRRVLGMTRSVVPAPFSLAVQGRKSMCPVMANDPELARGAADEMARLCRELKSRPEEKCCSYYRGLRAKPLEALGAFWRGRQPKAEEAFEALASEGVCPYEAGKLVAPEAVLVAAPYLYLFHSGIRPSLLDWMNCDLRDLVVVVDEAHNLPEFARSLASADLSSHLLTSAHREAEEFGDPVPAEGVTATKVMVALGRILTHLADSYLLEEKGAEDALVPGDELKVELMHALVAPSTRIDGIVLGLEAIGEAIRSQRAKEGRLPRSYIGAVASFLSFWLSLEEERYARLVCDREDPRLQAYCLDPSTVAGVLDEVHASVHISGTLSPLEQYRDTLGLARERTTLVSIPSPFPPENRLAIYDDRVTTRYEEINADETVLPRLHATIVALCNGVSRAKAVFFPSHALLSGFARSPEFRELRDGAFVESAEMTQADLMVMVSEFKRRRTLLLAVMGGRVGEGLDFPEEELEMVVLAGIPYPRPTARLAALERYCERRFGRGWEYAVRGPTIRRMLQTMGRLIRTERDRGVVVVLDKRARQFSAFVSGLRLSRDPLGDSLRFYSGEPAPSAEPGAASRGGERAAAVPGFEPASKMSRRAAGRE